MAEAGDDVAIISVKFTSSDKAAGQVSMTLASTIGSLKEAIRSNFKVEPKRLIFQGRILNKDNQTLEECKLKDGLTVVVQAAPAAAPTPPPPSGGAPPLASPAPSASPAPPTNASATARQAAAQAFGRGPGGGSAVGGVGAASPVALAVATVRAQPAGVARDCLMTLTKIIDNIVAHPTEDKYRKIKRSNAGFLRKVGGVPGGEACMRGLGFVEADADQGSWLLTPSAAAWNVLTTGRVQIQSALATLPSAAFGGGAETGASPPAGFAVGLGERPPPGAFPGGFGGGFAGGYDGGFGGGFGGGGMGMGGGMGGMGAGMPDMATMARMVQDPAIMQGIMNDPSVQGMMRNNPQMAAAMQSAMANPERMSQAMNLMETNPAMAQMAQQMMQDPTALQRASQMDLGGALAAGINAGANPAQGFPPPLPGVGGQGGFAMPPAPAAAPAAAPATAPTTVPSPPATDTQAAVPAAGGIREAAQVEEEMTEDELVAEAIRRSMEDI